MKKNFKEKLISSWKVFIKDPILHILFAIILVTVYAPLLFMIGTVVLRFDWVVRGHDILAYFGTLFGSIGLLCVYIHLKEFYQNIKDLQPKTKTKFELYQGEDEAANQTIWVFYIIAYPLLIYSMRTDLDEKLGGYFWLLFLGVLIVSYIIVVFVRWIGTLISRRFKAKRESSSKPINSSENRLPQHLEKSTPRKDQDDQGMVAKGKKEKSLYQRLKEMPYSKDRVGQSFIIVRGGNVGKSKNGDGGGDEKDG
jgi:Na+-transporting methylmalonyl-CoA/oxaloacetate decarboxylase gamma subunit